LDTPSGIFQSNGDKTSPSFKPQNGKLAGQILAYEEYIAVSFKHDFISATSFQDIASSKRTLNDISLLSEALLNIR
jgi:hypothetical protein